MVGRAGPRSPFAGGFNGLVKAAAARTLEDVDSGGLYAFIGGY